MALTCGRNQGGSLEAYFLRLDLRSFKLVAGKNIEIEVEQAMSRYVLKSYPSLAVMAVYGGDNWWCLALNPPL